MNIQDFYGFFAGCQVPLGRVMSRKNLQGVLGVLWSPLVLKVRRQAAVTLKRSWTKDLLVKIQFAMAAATFDHKILTTFDDIF